jgi:putative tryptophan/tyrosine transport system substrate-binding protein
MKRRDFIALIGGGTVAWPIAARAQQAKGAVRIAFLFFGNASNAYDQSLVNAFREGLHQVGLIEDRDIVLDVVWISADADQAVIEAIKRGAELRASRSSGPRVTRRTPVTLPSSLSARPRR